MFIVLGFLGKIWQGSAYFQINADQVLRLNVDHGRSFIVMKPTSHDQDGHIICFVNQPVGVINAA
jgi:predicted glycosyltransferase